MPILWEFVPSPSVESDSVIRDLIKPHISFTILDLSPVPIQSLHLGHSMAGLILPLKVFGAEFLH